MSKAGATKPPATKDEYESMLTELKGKGVQGFWVSPFQFTGGFTFQSLLWQFGGDTFDKDLTKATFDSDAGVQALQWLVDCINKGWSPKNVGQDADYGAFKNNKNAFNWNGKIPARASVAESPEFKKLTEEYSLAPEAAYVHFPPAVPRIGDALTEIYNAYNKAVLFKASPKDALAEGAKKATQILQDNQKKYG